MRIASYLACLTFLAALLGSRLFHGVWTCFIGGRRHRKGSRTGGGGSMKVGRRYALLLAVVLAAALALLGARATPAAHAGAKAANLTIWVDNVQKPAITKVADAWATRRGV